MLTWEWRTFEELTRDKLYDILALRFEVFVIEQKCFYMDVDYKDQKALHLLGIENNKLVAYLRLFLPNTLLSDKASLGRVAVAPQKRRQQMGKKLIHEALRYLEEKRGSVPILISAQLYLEKWYETFGFRSVGEAYDDEGIMHIDMLKMNDYEQR